MAASCELPFDALVVLGCRMGEQFAGAARRRVARALGVYQDSGAELVVVSGGVLWQGQSEAAAFANWLVAQGVPRERLLEEARSRDTVENARETARLLGERRAGRVGLVTCDTHMTRACTCFALLGIDVIALPCITPPQSLPSRGRIVVREWVGTLAAHLRLRQERA